MRAVSLCELMIDVLVCGDARESVRQTLTLSKLTGTMAAGHSFGRDIMTVQTFARKTAANIVMIFWSLLSGHMHVLLVMLSF